MLFDGPCDYGKIAVAGHWEAAIRFAPGDIATLGDASGYVAGDELACEAFFGRAFIGVRRRGPAEELAAFVLAFATAMREGLFEGLQGLGIPLRQRFLYAEIGAEGAWDSVGAFRIVDPKVALRDFDDVWAELAVSSVYADRVHAKALEYVYDNGDGTTHWFAVPLSKNGRICASTLVSALSNAEAGPVDRYRIA